MATKKSGTKFNPDTFTKKMAKLDSEYRIILAHISLLEEQKAKIEAEIQALLDSAAGLSV